MAINEGVSRAFVSDLAISTKRGLAFGTYHTIVGITVLPANLLGGLLWQRLGVQAPFIYAAIISILSALLLIFFIKNKTNTATNH
jgi:MFS family permease